MKLTKSLACLAAAGAMMLASCSKPANTPPIIQNGVDTAKLTQAFENSSPEVRSALQQALLKVRYVQYPEAMAMLDQLASDPNVTDAQKTALTNAVEQIKALAATTPAPAENQ